MKRAILLLSMMALGTLPRVATAQHSDGWRDAGSHRWREVKVEDVHDVGFSRMEASHTGVAFSNSIPEDSAILNRVLANGSGVALGDFDADGRTDIFLAAIDGGSALYRNLGGWRFEDVSRTSGVADAVPHRATGATFADTDGDGDLDLLVAGVGVPLVLLANDGGRFSDATNAAGLGDKRGGSSLALADVDGDGDLDLYVSNYKQKFAADVFSPQERAFDQVARRTSDGLQVVERFREHYGLVTDSARRVVIKTELAEPDWFYLNDGSGRFTWVPFTSGRFLDADGRPLAEEPRNFGLAVRFHDVNGDGAPDIYVCNDFEHPDMLWINDGAGGFRKAPWHALRTTSFSSMGVDFADLDRDGDSEIFVVDMLSRSSRRRKLQVPPLAPLTRDPANERAVEQTPQNTLLLNRGDGSFAQIGNYAGIEASDWSWTPLFLDADLDGYEDLFITNGYHWDATNSDTLEKTRLNLIGVPWREEMRLFPPLPMRNVAFRNNGDLTFSETGSEWGFGLEPDISHGMAAGDLDGDGDLDLVVNRWRAPAALYRNDVAAPRVAVRLAGRQPNVQAIGARIRVEGGPGGPQTKEVTLGGHYLSSSDPLYSFATGTATEITIRVRWRDGGETVVHAAPGRLYEIRAEAVGTAPAAAHADTDHPHFSDATALLAHRHTDLAHDDHARQPLLPNSFSGLGPGVAWYDVDRDGDDDLLVSGGTGGSLRLMINDGGSFVGKDVPVPGGHDQSAIVATAAADGNTRVLVGQSNYEKGGGVRPIAVIPPVVSIDLAADGSTGPSQSVTRPDSSSAGPLALADIDGDGDLDLFVGGRFVPGRYPEPASSRIYLANGDGWVLDTLNFAALSGIGLVSAATFSDTDLDGDPDLLLAREWGSVLVLENRNGRFRDSADPALAKLPGRWNGIATGDLNSDGRPDLVITGFGRNTPLRASEEKPLLMFYDDFDRNGILDPLLAQEDPEVGDIAPLQSLSRLTLGLSNVRQRVPSFAAFGAATVADVVGPRFARARRLEAVTLDHTLFLSRSDGSGWDATPLPAEAQLAVAFSVGVADFDGDGFDDVFLGQNFFDTELGVLRSDAGTGLWLRGDGRGGLAAVAPAESGIRVNGDARGAAFADYDGDGRVDIAVGQNAGPTRLFHNDAAAPGLRVVLRGTPSNPHGIGAAIVPMYGDVSGPTREVQAGSGYWSASSPIQILGARDRITAVEVRWPGGVTTRTAVPAGAREISVVAPAPGASTNDS